MSEEALGCRGKWGRLWHMPQQLLGLFQTVIGLALQGTFIPPNCENFFRQVEGLFTPGGIDQHPDAQLTVAAHLRLHVQGRHRFF